MHKVAQRIFPLGMFLGSFQLFSQEKKEEEEGYSFKKDTACETCGKNAGKVLKMIEKKTRKQLNRDMIYGRSLTPM